MFENGIKQLEPVDDGQHIIMARQASNWFMSIL